MSLNQFFETMGRFEVLEHDAIIDLAFEVQDWQQHPDGPDGAPLVVQLKGRRARDKMVSHNLRLIVHIWKRHYSVRLPQDSPGLSDAFQQCSIDLTRAAEKYLPSKARFTTYAAVWIHKGFRQYLTNCERTIRIPGNAVNLLKAAQAMVYKAKEEGRPVPSVEEMHAHLSTQRKHMPTVGFLRELIEADWRTSCVSFDMQTCDSDGEAWINFIPDVERGDSELEAMVDSISTLTLDEQILINGRYLKERPFSQSRMGMIFNCNKHKISKMEEDAIQKMREYCMAG